jgi:hypothetical protein
VTAKSVSMGAPFQWLIQAFESARRNPRVLITGFALIAAIALVPSVFQIIVDQAAPANMTARGSVMLLSMLYGVLVMPPLMGAAFQLLHRLENDVPAQAGDVLAAYSDGGFVQRMIGLSVSMFVLNIATFVLLYVLLPGKAFWIEIFRRSLTTPPGAEPDMTGLPPFPPSTLLWMLLAMFLMIVLMNVHMFAFTRGALGGRGPFAAIGDAFAAVLRNLLPLLGFAFAAGFVGMLLAMLLGMILAVVMAVAMLISPVLGAIIVLPAYLAMMVLMYVTMFGFYYHASREVFAGDAALEAPPANDTIAL